MTKRFSFEIKIIGILLVMLTLVAFTGVYAYQRFSGIVNQINDTTRPDMRLLTAKAVANHINDAEINVKSYRITEDSLHLNAFYNAVENIDNALIELHGLSINHPNENNALELTYLDSLISEKVQVLHNLLVLQNGFRTQKALDKVVAEIEDNQQERTPTIKDTISKTEKKRMFDWLFKNKKNEDPIISSQDSLITMDEINQEVSLVKQQEFIFETKFREKELEYITQDQLLSEAIKTFFNELEAAELKTIAAETEQAEIAISKTNRQIAIFCIQTGLMIVFMAFIIINYVRNNNKYRRALKESKKQAEDLAKTKQKFLANMSHEIRTPMNAIAGFSEQIGKGPLTDSQKEQLDMVKKSADHLLYLINEVLDLSKLQSKYLQLEQIGFQPAELITDMSKFLKNEANSKGLGTETNIEGTLPAVLLGDPYRLQQILFNLIGNAIKFTDSGSVNVFAKAKKTSNETCVLSIRIEDTGIGIAKENLSKIFNEFEQAKTSTTRNYGGTGLGLSIVKLLIELHGGNIEIASEINKGTAVTIEIPYKISSNSALPTKEGAKKFNDKALKGKNILIVDDEKFNRLLIISVLKKYNATYAQAANGEEVIKALEKTNFDLILMDIRMPLMNGVEAAKAIRKMKGSKANIPIIALTAAVSEKDRETYIRAGMNAFLAKPFKEDELMQEISTILKIDAENIKAKTTEKSQTDTTTIDLSELKRMCGDDDGFYLDMLYTFVNGTQSGIEKIQENLQEKNWDKIADQAHKISSPCKHLGANDLHSQLKMIENNCRDKENINTISNLVQRAIEESERVIRAVETEISRIN